MTAEVSERKTELKYETYREKSPQNTSMGEAPEEQLEMLPLFHSKLLPPDCLPRQDLDQSFPT